jgi:prepilin-type N-terminal cleavage/methylation domain-containing protein
MARNLGRNQKGFTLIELVIAIGISGLIVAAASATLIHIVRSADSSAHMVALRWAQNAGYWVSEDALQAQNVTPTGPTGFPLTLYWEEWDGNSHNITYSLGTTSGELQRSDGATNIIVARYLTNNTTCNWTAGMLTFTVEASVAGAQGEQTVIRTYEVTPRCLS